MRVTFNAHIDAPIDPTWNLVILAVLSTIEVSVGICCACMPVIYPLLRILVRNKNKPSRNSSSTLGAGYHKELLRPRHHFSQIEEGPATSHIWNSNLQSGNINSISDSGGCFDDIPLGSIKVTKSLDVERTGAK